MNERIQKLIKPGIIIAALTFAICCLIKKPQEFGDYTSNVSYAVTVKNGRGKLFLGIGLQF